ncbi:polyamine ABC transporter ATP-binding protein [Microtetraspora fusca]|uniref:polyamine ABC transporter ATP-binding protein n=1 Tax=Microtetraspora fusca TaxID=1997 RepID=UPI000A0191AD|nr:polyamine ABC transporter ATP-binding protein [Microtetraspora fusca]
MTLISIDGVSRRFGDVTALDSVSLEIRQGEFFALLGPSGCGKTTLLRILAGFEQPDDGAVSLDGEDLLKIAPHRRPINLMFQSYALFPHMTVERNIAYGLEREKLPKKEIRERVAEVLETVGLSTQARRKPHQLSGGQRQRVALARAIVKRPRLLLLDEPLSALDKKVRAEMQLELKRLQHEVGITFVVVTHDQEEAMSLADRIAVMQGGKVEQVDAPIELYDRPRTPFVAGFIGANNIFSGKVTEGGVHVDGIGLLPAPKGVDGDTALLAVRPEKVRLTQIAPKAEEAVEAVEAKADAEATSESADESKDEATADNTDEAKDEAKDESEAKDEATSEEAADAAEAKTDAEATSESAAETKDEATSEEAAESTAEAEVKEGPVKTDEGAEPKAPEPVVPADEAESAEPSDEVQADESKGEADAEADSEPVAADSDEAEPQGDAVSEAEPKPETEGEAPAEAEADGGTDLRVVVKDAMSGELDAEAMAEVVSKAVAGVVAKVVAEVVAEVIADNDAKARAKTEEKDETAPEAEVAAETETTREPAPETSDAPETAPETVAEAVPVQKQEVVAESGDEDKADAEPEAESPLRGTVVDVSFYGGTSHIVLRVEGHEGHVLAATQGSARVEPGTEVAIGWDAADAVLIPA